MFASHSWPRWGNARILEVMRAQRDAYAHLNNHVLHLANSGVTINQVHNVYKQPKSLQKQWAAHSYHGSEAHNSRAVINRYLGYWDANPATLIPLSPGDAAPLYVEMMGGAERIISKGRELYDQGKYLHAQEIVNKLVYAEPRNQAAKDLLAGAYELRSGIPTGTSPKGTGPDMIRAMTTGLWLDFLGVRMQSEKTEGNSFVVNFVTPDNGEKFVIELSNETLTTIKGHQAKSPTLTITVNRADLEQVMMGQATFDDLIAAGKAKLDGDRKPYDVLKTRLVQFDMGFEILPGTKAAPETPKMSPFQQAPPARSDGG
jgi:alkyl sulfatase BDS1-like metallo-beta-lactamase superfamily hydrolase